MAVLRLKHEYNMPITNDKIYLPNENKMNGSQTQFPIMNGGKIASLLKSISEREYLKKVEKTLRNIPLLFLYDKEKSKIGMNQVKTKGHKHTNFFHKNKMCGILPNIYDIHFNNIYWQEHKTRHAIFYLYGAYLDTRQRNAQGPTIRILSMLDRGLKPKTIMHCLIWFDNDEKPVVSKISEFTYIWYETETFSYNPGIFRPYLLSCKIPKTHSHKIPISISVVNEPCDIVTNSLKVIFNKEKGQKNDFAVCVKGLSFPTDDLSSRLVEWIELLHLLGVDKLFFYDLGMHPNVQKVMQYYVKKGLVDLTPISLPGNQPNEQVLQHFHLINKHLNDQLNEVLPYNDCLYRNMYHYSHIAVLDTDEVIIPRKPPGKTWKDLIKQDLSVFGDHVSSYNFRNTYFMEEMLKSHLKSEEPEEIADIPEFMHMLRHVYRSKTHSPFGKGVKSIHNTDHVKLVLQHYPFECLDNQCYESIVNVSVQVAHLHHYRQGCQRFTSEKECNEDYKKVVVKDTTLLKFKQQLLDQSIETLSQLGLIK